MGAEPEVVVNEMSATVAAVERGDPGIYNVADDDPAPTAEWLPELAQIVGAPQPRHVPVRLGRVLGGEAVASMFTPIRGAANDKAKRELGWTPRYASWREGFRYGAVGSRGGVVTGDGANSSQWAMRRKEQS